MTRLDLLRTALSSTASELRAACAARDGAAAGDALEHGARLALEWPSTDGVTKQRIEAAIANARSWLPAADLAAVADVADLLDALAEAPDAFTEGPNHAA